MPSPNKTGTGAGAVTCVSSDVTRICTEKYFADKPGAAPRPLNSVLDLSKIQAAGFSPRDWREVLPAYLDGVETSA